MQASIRSNFLEDVLPMPPSPSALMGRARELVVRGSVDLEAVLRGRSSRVCGVLRGRFSSTFSGP